MSKTATPVSILISGVLVAAAICFAPARNNAPPAESPKETKGNVVAKSPAASASETDLPQWTVPFVMEPEDPSQSCLATSKDQRELIDKWERYWFLDKPDAGQPYRIHGGII